MICMFDRSGLNVLLFFLLFLAYLCDLGISVTALIASSKLNSGNLADFSSLLFLFR